jgi:hypothetical protein
LQTNIQIALSCYVIARVCWHAATSPTEGRIDPEDEAKLLSKDEARRFARNGQIVLALKYPFDPGIFPARAA